MKHESPLPLVRRFADFVATLDGYEDCEQVLKGVPKGRRADYLFRGRAIVAEQKEASSEALPILNAIDRHANDLAKKYRLNPRIDTLPLETLTAEERRTTKILLLKWTRNIERYMSEAEKQIRGTKQKLEIPQAGGMLIILNESAGLIIPQVIQWKVQELFNRAREDQPRFSNVNGVLLIQRFRGFTIRGYSSLAGFFWGRYARQDVTDFA